MRYKKEQLFVMGRESKEDMELIVLTPHHCYCLELQELHALELVFWALDPLRDHQRLHANSKRALFVVSGLYTGISRTCQATTSRPRIRGANDVLSCFLFIYVFVMFYGLLVASGLYKGISHTSTVKRRHLSGVSCKHDSPQRQR